MTVISPAFDLLLPRRIIFGWGRRTELPQRTRELGNRAWLVLGSRSLQTAGIERQIADGLQQVGVRLELLAIQTGEPTVEQVDTVTRDLRQRIDVLGPAVGHWLLAVGGGSAIDLAKGVAAMLTNSHGASVTEFLEGIGTGRSLNNRPLPLVALPTTAGTGAEATRNAVLTSKHHHAKKSLRADGLMPELVIVDPELTVSAPPAVTASSGLDALTQLLESAVTRRFNPAARALAFAGMAGFPQALRTAINNPSDQTAREVLARGALFSGIALANSGLGLAHGVAAGLGALFAVPHGTACAAMLPATLGYNHEHCVHEYAEAVRRLFPGAPDDDQAAVQLLIDEITALVRDCGIPTRLNALGVTGEDVPRLAAASRGNSLDGNPCPITPAELETLLRSLL